MTESIYNLPNDLGKTLAELRKAAKKNQVDIATTLNVAQSYVSRIEKGKIIPSDAEIGGYLNALETDEAQNYLAFLKPWQNLKRPSFRNPQRDELWKAEIALQELKNLISDDAPDYLLRQAEMYERRVPEEAEYLISLDHSIPYVGSIGVGKTTTICKLTELVIPQEKQFNRQSVLAVGAGRTTVCEVCIRRGEKIGIRVKPQSSDELNKLLEDFFTDNKSNNQENQESQSEIAVSQEIQRLLLNMAGLKPEDFTDLIREYDNPNTLRLKFLELLNLQERTREEIWFEETSSQTGIEWLKETFKLINYGLHKEFFVPQQIEIIVPNNSFSSSPYELEFIDTRGIDKEGTAIRRDLMHYLLNNDRAIVVLCSRFKDAPDREISDLIKNLAENGAEKVLKQRVIILILPQNDEAYDIVDNTGEPVSSEQEGHNIKCNEIRKELQPFLKEIEEKDIPILFFNAKSKEDRAKDIAKAIIDKINDLRSINVKKLSKTVDAINVLIKNQKEQNARDAYKEVNESLKAFVQRHRNQPLRLSSLQANLITEMDKTHAGTIRATIRRNGTLDKFDVYFILGNGARSVAWLATRSAFYGLKEMITTMNDRSKLQPAHNFLGEILENWEDWHEDFLKYAQRSGENIFRQPLLSSSIWGECLPIKGSGFRKEVIRKLRHWFNAPEQNYLHNSFNNSIEQAWQERVLAQLENITDNSKVKQMSNEE